MGIFSKFKKNNEYKENIVNNRQPVYQLPVDVKISPLSNGNLQIDFYDKNPEFGNFYDTTRLIIGMQPLNIEGHQVYNCAVSWYGKNDCQMFDKRTGKFESQRAQDYREILAEIDLRLLQSDPNYCNTLIKLLDQKRVEKYLANGLNENPELPCGEYIGGVKQMQGGYYGKFFDKRVGLIAHNSELMINKRQEHRRIMQEQRLNAIANKRAQIEKLQNEISNMER